MNNIWVPLIYDKYCGDHNFNNPVTVSDDLDNIINNWKNNIDKNVEIKYDIDAVDFFNITFKGFTSIPKLDYNLYNVRSYIEYSKYFDDKKYIIHKAYTIIFVNPKKLEYFIDNKINIPNIDFIKMTCRFHIKYINSKDLIYNSFNTRDKINSNIDKIIKKVMIPSIYNIDE